MLRFATEEEALQHLSDITGKRVKIASEDSIQQIISDLDSFSSEMMDDIISDYKDGKIGKEELRKEIVKFDNKTESIKKRLNDIESGNVKVAGERIMVAGEKEDDMIYDLLTVINSKPEIMKGRTLSRVLQSKIINEDDFREFVDMLNYISNPIPEAKALLEEIKNDMAIENDVNERHNKEYQDHMRSMEDK